MLYKKKDCSESAYTNCDVTHNISCPGAVDDDEDDDNECARSLTAYAKNFLTGKMGVKNFK